MSESYNLLRNTWIYHDIKQEVQKELQLRYVEEQRYVLLEIVRARFPRVEALIQQLIKDNNEPDLLQTLIIQVGTARLEKDARQNITKIAREHTAT